MLCMEKSCILEKVWYKVNNYIKILNVGSIFEISLSILKLLRFLLDTFKPDDRDGWISD